MARTLYFTDGSHEVLFCEETNTEANEKALERILRERLGEDTATLLLQVLRERREDLEALEDEFKSYEGSCGSYRACLSEVRGLTKQVLLLLGEQHIDRKKITSLLNSIVRNIHNEL